MSQAVAAQPPAARENLINLQPLKIPRPKCSGMEFVATRGRQGFYMSLSRRSSGVGGGYLTAPTQPRRPALSSVQFTPLMESAEAVATAPKSTSESTAPSSLSEFDERSKTGSGSDASWPKAPPPPPAANAAEDSQASNVEKL